MKKIAIIVAGGSGQRMNSSVAKQFLLLRNKPILFHTLLAFKVADPSTTLIVVLPANQIDYWQALCKQFPEIEQKAPHQVVAGGETRFHSSKNGINTLVDREECLVAIHDGVRPLIDPETINKAFSHAEKVGNCVVAVSSKDSIRFWDSESQSFKSVLRDEVKIIQTPQIFALSSLKKAFDQEFSPLFTDDASVIEATGETIHLIEGTYTNLKITTPEDLLVAESILQPK
ncbi:2-C-methyl-D-erythritol 4-phosphate cytidylyltransferase [Aquirufa sp.]|uniref:2-C-methyl-D-erythritol 4-phosphate cytidylyltransferase n=1 Tax=Aquirufa sp. TaxID=2676249 RepID=UPI0037C05650